MQYQNIIEALSKCRQSIVETYGISHVQMDSFDSGSEYVKSFAFSKCNETFSCYSYHTLLYIYIYIYRIQKNTSLDKVNIYILYNNIIYI